MTRGVALCLALSLTMLGALACPPLRAGLEAGMRTHMLVQFPLVLAAGALMAPAMPASAARALAKCNALGLSGLTLLACVLAMAMIPRLLDLALVDGRIEALKFAALAAAGAAARASWRAAGPVVQAFFVGSVLPMTVAAGSLFIEAPVRLCNAYLLGEQQRLGAEVVALATACGVVWLAHALYRSGANASEADADVPAWHAGPGRRSR